jgi:hypothetical protein
MTFGVSYDLMMPCAASHSILTSGIIVLIECARLLLISVHKTTLEAADYGAYRANR